MDEEEKGEKEKMSEAEKILKLRELIEEGVLVETDPEEVILSDGYTEILERALKGLRSQELAGEEFPEDLVYGASMLAYIKFRGTVDETELPLKVGLISTFLEVVQEGRLEEWAMKTRIRRL